jgi:2-polyprenyl-3-methyl-5-hydroxy-6-metoxy-1,4-benzoquinol methylase
MQEENREKYYEKYWQRNDAPPTQDPLSKKRLEIFLKEIKKYPGIKKILDVGCGDGRISKALKEAGFNVVGLDISRTAIEKAKQNFRGIDFLVASPEEKLPFEDENFDSVYCTEVIEHLYDTAVALKEITRVLKKEGLLFISTPYHGFLKNLLITIFGFEKHFDPLGSHIRFFTKDALVKLLEEEGFFVEKIHYLGRFFPIWMDIVILAKKM